MSDLQYLVKAVNRANKWANELHETLHTVLVPFVGKKILRVDGAFTANVKAVVPSLPYDNTRSTYWGNTKYSVYLHVKVCEAVPPGTCVYHDTAIHLGELRDDVLVSVSSPTTRRTEWTVAEVLSKRDAYRQAKQSLDDCESALYPFSTR